MDGIIVTAAVILTVIAIIETVTILCSKPFGKPAYIAVIPVFAEDTSLQARLERMSLHSLPAMVLLDISATPEQKQICQKFSKDNPSAEIVPISQFESYLSQIFVNG